ncbi:MAG: hypothetical protein IT430_03875 [Phycisphaerales bacterium]|nr:hypothetical protein [Phycisphaerales bacterium]
MDYVKNDVHFHHGSSAVLCHMPKGRQRFNPTLPDWLYPMLEEEKRALGPGDKTHGAAQRVAMAALMIYFALPEDDRRNLARLMSKREKPSVSRDFEAHWIGDAIEAISELGEAETMQFVKGMRARLERLHTLGTSGGRPGAASHTSKRRRPA